MLPKAFRDGGGLSVAPRPPRPQMRCGAVAFGAGSLFPRARPYLYSSCERRSTGVKSVNCTRKNITSVTNEIALVISPETLGLKM